MSINKIEQKRKNVHEIGLIQREIIDGRLTLEKQYNTKKSNNSISNNQLDQQQHRNTRIPRQNTKRCTRDRTKEGHMNNKMSTKRIRTKNWQRCKLRPAMVEPRADLCCMTNQPFLPLPLIPVSVSMPLPRSLNLKIS